MFYLLAHSPALIRINGKCMNIYYEIHLDPTRRGVVERQQLYQWCCEAAIARVSRN